MIPLTIADSTFYADHRSQKIPCSNQENRIPFLKPQYDRFCITVLNVGSGKPHWQYEVVELETSKLQARKFIKSNKDMTIWWGARYYNDLATLGVVIEKAVSFESASNQSTRLSLRLYASLCEPRYFQFSTSYSKESLIDLWMPSSLKNIRHFLSKVIWWNFHFNSNSNGATVFVRRSHWQPSVERSNSCGNSSNSTSVFKPRFTSCTQQRADWTGKCWISLKILKKYYLLAIETYPDHKLLSYTKTRIKAEVRKFCISWLGPQHPYNLGYPKSLASPSFPVPSLHHIVPHMLPYQYSPTTLISITITYKQHIYSVRDMNSLFKDKKFGIRILGHKLFTCNYLPRYRYVRWLLFNHRDTFLPRATCLKLAFPLFRCINLCSQDKKWDIWNYLRLAGIAEQVGHQPVWPDLHSHRLIHHASTSDNWINC